MTRAALRKQAADAGVVGTGAYIEWLEKRLIEMSEKEPREEEETTP